MTITTRRDLYELIWSKPMRDAAADIGISDVGLKKVCIRHRVPVPPQGYWNKVRAGHSMHKALFRDIDDPALDRISIDGARYLPPPAVQKVLAEAKAREKAPERKIEVPPVTAPSTPVGTRLAAVLKKSNQTKEGSPTRWIQSSFMFELVRKTLTARFQLLKRC